ncbi:TPA: hypothetical protein HA246_06405 [Candidatus Woesearchaeota archaeon]|nr:hypothetical protein [Candidatus Woesearchaeota archaeon]
MSTDLDDPSDWPKQTTNPEMVSNIARLVIEERETQATPTLLFLIQCIENERRRQEGKEVVDLIADLNEVSPEQIDESYPETSRIPVESYRNLRTNFTSHKDYLALHLLLIDYARILYDHGLVHSSFAAALNARLVGDSLTRRDVELLKRKKFDFVNEYNFVKSIDCLSEYLDKADKLEEEGSDEDARNELERMIGISERLNIAGLLTDSEFTLANTYLNLEICRLYEKQGNIEKAIEYAANAKQNRFRTNMFVPGFVNLKLASLLIKAGRYNEALGEAEIASMNMPKNRLVYLTRLNALLGLNRYKEAIPELANAIYLTPGNLTETIESIDEKHLEGLLAELKCDEVVTFTATSEHEFDDSDIREGMPRLFNEDDVQEIQEKGILEKGIGKIRYKIMREANFENSRGNIRYTISISLNERTPQALRYALQFANIISDEGGLYFENISRADPFGYKFNRRVVIDRIPDKY